MKFYKVLVIVFLITVLFYPGPLAIAEEYKHNVGVGTILLLGLMMDLIVYGFISLFIMVYLSTRCMAEPDFERRLNEILGNGS